VYRNQTLLVLHEQLNGSSSAAVPSLVSTVDLNGSAGIAVAPAKSSLAGGTAWAAAGASAVVSTAATPIINARK